MSVYILRAEKLVKIGFSDDLPARVRSIIALVPVQVDFVGWMPGGKDVEAHLHERFAGSLFSGEWFVETDEMRAAFAAILDPEMPTSDVATPDPKRKGSDEDIVVWRERARKHAADRWPSLPHGKRIEALAADLGWNRNRVKDLYYADSRMSLRAFEERDLARWLALRIAPELRGEG